MSDFSKRYLVLCTANRCRSQMAHGWLQHLGGDAVVVKSAGTKPGGVHRLSVAVMAEAGVDLSGHTSDVLTDYLDEPFDVVVTVCGKASENCPVFPGARRMLHRPFDDPDDKTGLLREEEMLPTFRRVRDEIRGWAEAFLVEEGFGK
ncbi:MAG: arsenate reductase ArsC [Algisphaera sp.]